MTNLTILRRFEFRSQLPRSGVVARDAAVASDDALFFIRGAPGQVSTKSQGALRTAASLCRTKVGPARTSWHVQITVTSLSV